MENHPCNVAIVGCGLGGVAAALAIRKAGHEVVLYERSEQLTEIGAGIQIPSNCTSILKQWGLLSAIESISVQPLSADLRAYKDGKVLYRRTQSLQEPHLLTHRADFLRVLYQEALKRGVVFRFGTPIKSIDFARPSLRFPDGEEVRHDVIFGADGQRSFCRESLLGRPDPPRMSGDVAYRIVIPVHEMEQDKELATLLENHNIGCWMGPGAHVVCYQLKALFNIVFIASADTPSSSGSEKTNYEDIQRRLANWDPVLGRLFRLATKIMKGPCLDSHEMDSWSHPSGTFALIGDACHVSTPHLAQGAAQAVEDGGTLGALFAKIESKAQVKDVLSVYEAIRKPRTTAVIVHSHARKKVYQLPDGPAQEQRDFQLTQSRSGSEYPACIDDPKFQSWIANYDVGSEVDKAWQSHQGSKSRIKEASAP